MDRDISFDLLRSLMAFFVVLLHLSAAYISHSVFASSYWVFYVFLDAITRVSVPVFIMISGWFMLLRQYSIKQVLFKSLRLGCILIFWSLVYLVVSIISQGLELKVTIDYIKQVFIAPQHFWYIYTAIALYLATPILYVFAQHASKCIFQYFIIIVFIFGSVFNLLLQIDYFTVLSSIVANMHIDFFMGFTGCYLFGFYYKKYGIKRKNILYAFGILGVIITFLGTIIISIYQGQNDYILFSFLAPNCILSSMALFVFFCEKFSKTSFSQKSKTAINKAASCSLGIYIIHMLLIDFLIKYLPNRLYEVPLLITSIFVFVICFLIIFVIKKIPWLNKLL